MTFSKVNQCFKDIYCTHTMVFLFQLYYPVIIMKVGILTIDITSYCTLLLETHLWDIFLFSIKVLKEAIAGHGVVA